MRKHCVWHESHFHGEHQHTSFSCGVYIHRPLTVIITPSPEKALTAKTWRQKTHINEITIHTVGYVNFGFFRYNETRTLYTRYKWNFGAWGSVVVKALRYKSEGPGIDSRCRRDFSRGIWQFQCPGVDSASKHEYQDNPGGKGGRCVRLTTYHLHVPIVKKSEGLNLLEPCGPVQACNGTALPFTSGT